MPMRSRKREGLEIAAVGRSRGGQTTKIRAAVDVLGLPIQFLITPEYRCDKQQAEGLIVGLEDVDM
jgi:hypothetical protein